MSKSLIHNIDEQLISFMIIYNKTSCQRFAIILPRMIYYYVIIMFTCLIKRLYEISFCRSIITTLVEIIEIEIKFLNKFNVILSGMKLIKMCGFILLYTWLVRAKLFIITGYIINQAHEMPIVERRLNSHSLERSKA